VRRGARIAVVILLALAALLAVNAVVLDGQTRQAEVTAPGGEVLELTSVDLQVVDHPPTGEAAIPGEPIVLLHCFACSLRWWDAIVPVLNRDHRVITVDLIGHGGSEKPQSGYEVTAQGAAVAEALSELGVQRATIVGHGLGGLVATSLAETASEVADRLVLIGTPTQSGAEMDTLSVRLLRTPVVGEALWRVRFGSAIRSAYGAVFAPGFDLADGFDDPDQVVADSEAMSYGSFEDAEGAADGYLGEGALASRLTATGVPLLVLDGSEDQLLDPDELQADFDAVPGARSVLIDGSGNSPNVEAPEETAKLILDFAESGEPQDSHSAFPRVAIGRGK